MSSTDPDSIAAIAGLSVNHSASNTQVVEFVQLPYSGTNDVTRLTSTSNIGIPGVWLFRVDSTEIKGL